jgi:hypothetical protein
MMMCMKHWWNDADREEQNYSAKEKPAPLPFSHKTHIGWPGSENMPSRFIYLFISPITDNQNNFIRKTNQRTLFLVRTIRNTENGYTARKNCIVFRLGGTSYYHHKTQTNETRNFLN